MQYHCFTQSNLMWIIRSKIMFEHAFCALIIIIQQTIRRDNSIPHEMYPNKTLPLTIRHPLLHNGMAEIHYKCVPSGQQKSALNALVSAILRQFKPLQFKPS